MWFADEARVFAPLEADPREARMQVGFMGECAREHSGFLDVQFGGDLGIVRKHWRNQQFSLSVRGLMTSRFDACRENFPQYNTDFIGGLAAGYRYDRHALELLVYHQSSHLGDEILDWGERARIDYAREALRLLWGYDLFENFRVYAGAGVNVRADPQDLEGRLTLQTGAEYRFHVRGVPLYAAVDLQLREETDWSANVTSQVGVELGDPGLRLIKRPKLFIEHFVGDSPMGQFWDENEQHVMLGLKFEL